jgi:hypothetical protein
VDTASFDREVTAYPAITVIGRETPGPTRVAHRPPIETGALRGLAAQLTQSRKPHIGSGVTELSEVVAGSEPWVFDESDATRLVRRLEERFPALEEAGCRVGIGVATGADKAYIGPYGDLDVEADRKLPLAMTRDIQSGSVDWRGLGIVNPFADSGGLVDLRDYPRLRRYLEVRKEQIAGRHVAQKAPANWYRTIDRIYPELAKTPKLLIPDIKGEAHIVYESGRLYPHHNLYFITSADWDLRALRMVLLSGIAHLFVSTYSTKMRGGFLRFQAQYLRRIRVPEWGKIPADARKKLCEAARAEDFGRGQKLVARIYGLSEAEVAALPDIGKV